jgi:broad specificity phosphatase PhoE
MKTQTFYFVRHGESLLNAKGIRQGPDGSLSERGMAQAEWAGRMLAEEKITIILASPYQRTRETADGVNKSLKVPIEYSDLLIERRNPSEIVGKNKNDPEVVKIVNMIDNSYHDDNYRYSDEENFADMKARAKKCLAYLESRKEKNICVVTHSIYLKLFMGYMLKGDALTAQEYAKLSFFNSSNNAGITVARYYSGWFAPKKGAQWQLVAWDIHEDQDKKAPVGDVIQEHRIFD